MTYPEAIEINGVEYEINTGYEYALACFECINDTEISKVERAYGVIGLLYKQWPEDENEALHLAIKYLQCGKEKECSYKKADMDFDQDMNYIRSSFRSDYSIDLNKADLCWFEFCELLQGLTDDCILNRIRDIRNYDLSTIKDSKSRQKMVQAKKDVALPERLNEEEQNIIDDFFSQLKE